MLAYMAETSEQKGLQLFMAAFKALQHDGGFALRLGAA